MSASAAARVVHRTERTWQMWEAGDRRMDAAMWELFRHKTRHRIDDAAKSARMLVPKCTRVLTDGSLEFEYQRGTEPIRAVAWAELAAKVVERMRGEA